MKKIFLILCYIFIANLDGNAGSNIHLLTTSFTHPDLTKWAAENPLVLENFTRQDFVRLDTGEDYEEAIKTANSLADQRGILTFEFERYIISESVKNIDSLYQDITNRKIRTEYNYSLSYVVVTKGYKNNQLYAKFNLKLLGNNIPSNISRLLSIYIEEDFENFYRDSKFRYVLSLKKTLISLNELLEYVATPSTSANISKCPIEDIPKESLNSINQLFLSEIKYINLYYSFFTAKNTSVKYLIKYCWSLGSCYINKRGREYYKNRFNSFKGMVGEAIVFDHFVSDVIGGGNIIANTVIKNWNKEDPLKIVSATLYNSHTYTLHPNKDTDLMMDINIAEKGTFFIHPLVTTGVLGVPMLNDKTYSEKKLKFIYEIKTNNSIDDCDLETYLLNGDVEDESLSVEEALAKRLKYFRKGVLQLLINPDVLKNNGIPIYVIDEEFFRQLKYAKRSVSTINRSIAELLAVREGGIYPISNLNNDAKKLIDDFKNKIQKETVAPTCAGANSIDYYTY